MQASCFAGPLLEEPFVPAMLGLARPCPPRPGYIDLCFPPPGGWGKWCLPDPSRGRRNPAAPVALTIGPYGVQAHLVRDGGFGPALQSSSALPMILAGADVHVARKLICAGFNR